MKYAIINSENKYFTMQGMKPHFTNIEAYKYMYDSITDVKNTFDKLQKIGYNDCRIITEVEKTNARWL